ncbi:hypothetical protein PsorP6_000341 [Peronosclerospora sorghi]|uniref:Uncharacterized protein n=1 Tax=Peronosclerospora sorghi TaxID=230839 RepID=A0ACC0WS00_9STRA|nr:hypothetical protein PsorP6_000341 [Peronosclerospora sorghi]
MQTQQLLTCNEYDPLDAHFEELEEPGFNFLQHFIVTSPATQSETPHSNSNGYTSEESDYSFATPTDEQHYKDVSFGQNSSTSELEAVIGDLSTGNLTAIDSNGEKQKKTLPGKFVKGKTSKYRGVTQTSKTSWGAKYSAKRITNTCKTPEEAAHAYDEYLKTHHPLKYAKFANFCNKCNMFVNPLGLPQFQSKCTCSRNTQIDRSVSESASVSPKREIFNSEDITTPTSTPSLEPPMAPSPAGGPSTLINHTFCPNQVHEESTIFSSRRSSNMSISSAKFSFSEDTEHFFAESFNEVTNMSSDHGEAALSNEEPQQRDDSLSMTVIKSAGDSFTQKDNLDQIIKDIHHSTLPRSALKGHIVEENVADGNACSLTASSANEQKSQLGGSSTVQVEPTIPTLLDFGADELDQFTEYYLSDDDAMAVMHREMYTNFGLVQHNPILNGAQDPQLRKNHSLDFDVNNAVTSSSRSGIEMSDVKLEDTRMMESTMTVPLNVHASLIAPLASPQQAIIDIQTTFLEKYWRNDRKNIQCFPYCPEHGDYYRVRIENLQHRCKGVCRAPVKAHISIPATVTQFELLVLARCNSTFSRNMALMEQQTWNHIEMKSLQSVSAIGTIDHFGPLGRDLEGVQFDVTFYPDVWKFEFDLPKKRRHVQESSVTATSHGTDLDTAGDSMSAGLYFFEIDVFYSPEKTTFERLGHTESMNFEIGNTRTLLRQRNKMVGNSCRTVGPSKHEGQHDGDRLENADELPTKKKVKVYLGQRELFSGSMVSDTGSLSGRGIAKSRLSTCDIADDSISSSSKQNLPNDKTIIDMDVDGFFATDSNDFLFNHEMDSSDLPVVKSDVWKNLDVDMLQATSPGYHSYISQQQKSAYVQSTKSPITSTALAKFNARPAVSITSNAYSLSKLLHYSFVSVSLSMLLFPVGILLWLGILMIPPASSGIVNTLDSLSDMELSRANSCCISTDQRFVLSRLLEEKPKGGLFRYHGKTEVWRRLLYFTGAKLVVSTVSLVPTLVLTLFVGLFYPIRPVSVAIANAACRCALWSREYTRKTTGKPLASVMEYDNLVVLV